MLNKPQHLYYVDENGLKTEHAPPYIVGCKTIPTPAVTSYRSFLTIVIGCGNALRTQTPPYFVFQGQSMRQDLMANCSTGADGSVTKSWWSNSEAFQTYLNDHFLKYVHGRDKDKPIMLLFGGHKSHT